MLVKICNDNIHWRRGSHKTSIHKNPQRNKELRDVFDLERQIQECYQIEFPHTVTASPLWQAAEIKEKQPDTDERQAESGRLACTKWVKPWRETSSNNQRQCKALLIRLIREAHGRILVSHLRGGGRQFLLGSMHAHVLTLGNYDFPSFFAFSKWGKKIWHTTPCLVYKCGINSCS